MSSAISVTWRRHGGWILLVIGGVIAFTLGIRFVREVERLLYVPTGPIDLQLYHRLIRDWFAGIPVYAESRAAVHPPALFFMLWPIYGWLPEEATRWLFALTTALVVIVFILLVLRASNPRTVPERAFLAGLVLMCYPTAVTIGIGQVTLYVLLAALAGILLVQNERPGPGRDAVAGALLFFSLVKPNLTLPFFWALAFQKGSTRPLTLALAAYIAATAASLALHGVGLNGLPGLISAWYDTSERGLAAAGYGNVHAWLGALGLRAWIFPASALVLGLHGLWTYHHRRADPWVLTGVAAVVARIWAYHRLYDDLLLIFTLVALYRWIGRAPPESGRAILARILFALGSAALLAPATLLIAHAQAAVVAIWLLQLGFLMSEARPSPEPVRSEKPVPQDND